MSDPRGTVDVGWIADDLPVGVWVAKAPGGEFVYANRVFAEILGIGGRDDVAVGEYAAPYGIHTRTGELYPEDQMPFVRALRARETVIVDDIVIHRPDGGRAYIRAQAKPIFGEDGEITHVVIAFIDVTREVEAEAARAETEARLHRAQRMESIGNLAGGIAHDFNNLLATVRLLNELLMLDETDTEKLRSLQQIDRVTESAVQLTRALLGFARRGKNLDARVSLHEVLTGLAAILDRTLGRHIEIVRELHATRDVVVADFSQLEQVVMNLALNARDAMTGAGRITLRTRDAGPNVVFEVADTGSGIPHALRDRVFDPYFTTKSATPGAGSGLGLATVWGIVENHRGTIEVLDNHPRGTVMRVMLPAADQPRDAAPVRPATRLRRGTGTILLVDDDASVRETASATLRWLGYDVVEARDGAEAVEVYRDQAQAIAAVLLDMVMPRMDGRTAYQELKRIRADVPVLLTTGYALNDEAQRILDQGVRGFIAKPYSMAALSEALANVIAPAT